MKKTLLSLFLAMAVAAVASAAQQTEVDKGDRFDYKYPVFTQENPQAAQRMNRDIQKMVKKSRKDLRQPDMRAVGSNYEMIYENDQFVCLTFNTWYYYDKAAHGMYWQACSLHPLHGKAECRAAEAGYQGQEAACIRCRFENCQRSAVY